MLTLLLSSAASPFEATRQPSSGLPKAEDLPPAHRYDHDECTRSLLGEGAARPPWPMALTVTRCAFVLGCVLACMLTARFMRRRRPRPAAYPWRAVHV